MNQPNAIVQAKIHTLTQLPSIKVIKAHLVKALYNERAHIDDIAEIIRHDQSIASKVVSVANSAFLGFSGKINTIEKAVLLLGFDLVKSIALAASLFNVFPGRAAEVKQLWGHSYVVAVIASELGKRRALPAKNLCFLAGLVHDIGRLVLLKVGENAMAEEEAAALMRESDDKLLDLERKLFGCTHAQAGMWFLENLSFPKDVVQPVAYHHDLTGMPSQAEIAPLVYLAEGFSGIFSPQILHDSSLGERHQTLFASMGFTQDDMVLLNQSFEKEKESIGSFFEL